MKLMTRDTEKLLRMLKLMAIVMILMTMDTETHGYRY